MDKIATLTPFMLTWFLNYIIHSTILLGFTFVAHRFKYIQSRHLSELVWRTALFGGILTASIQLGIQVKDQAQNGFEIPTKPAIHLQSTALAEVSQTQSNSSIRLTHRDGSPSLPQKSPTSATTPAPVDPIQQATQKSITANNSFTLSEPSQQLAIAVTLAWLFYCLFVVTRIILSVWHLNHMVNSLPAIFQDDLLCLLNKRLPYSDNTQRLRRSSHFKSPFVCPNGCIVLPDWVLEPHSQHLYTAMLQHEIQHLVRHDGVWRITYELVKSIFFFQVLNRVAEHHLSVLAEIDCDQNAVKASSSTEFAEALLRCAEMSINSKQPNLALPMARSSTLLQRITFILNEDSMNTKIKGNQKHLYNAAGVSLALVAIATISGLVHAMPTIQFEKMAPVIQAPHMTHASATDTLVSATTAALPLTIAIEEKLTPPSLQGPNPEPILQTQSIQSTEIKDQIDLNEKWKQAQAAYAAQNFNSALSLYLELAKSGHIEAQVAAGEMLWRGESGLIDPEQAISLLTKAASQGNSTAKKYASLFTEREQRQSELDYFLRQFDGGALKWTDQTCVRPTIMSRLPSAKEYKDIINKVNANLSCYNSYIASLKQSHQSESYLNPNLRRVMRADEIALSKQLVEEVYYRLGQLAQRDSQEMLLELDKRNESWRNELDIQSLRSSVYAIGQQSEHFARVQLPPVAPETGERKRTIVNEPGKN